VAQTDQKILLTNHLHQNPFRTIPIKLPVKNLLPRPKIQFPLRHRHHHLPAHHQVVGEHCRDNDIVVNACRVKKLSNMRTTGSDENIILKPARKMTLEQALEYIEEDELVEVTPQHIRLRKELLTEIQRKRSGRKQAVTVEV